jgi:hypothetical protein
MSQESRKFYISLLQRDGATVGHVISFDPPERTGTGEIKREAAPEKKSDEEARAAPTISFQAVCKNFVSAMESYRKFIPLTLEIAPFLSAAIAERRIGEFVRSKGFERLDISNDKAKVFEIDINRYREFAVYNDEVRAALEGARHLPEVMVIGLISAYDAFLSQLLKVVLNLHEEIVLTSEKAILFSESRFRKS